MRACHIFFSCFPTARPQLNCELCYEIYKGECVLAGWLAAVVVVHFFMNSLRLRCCVLRVRAAIFRFVSHEATVLHSRCMNIYEDKYVYACAF